MAKYGPVRPGRADPTWVKPPKAAKQIAEGALRQQKKLSKSKRGGLSSKEARDKGITSGRDRARSIAAGELQPAEDLRDFFSRFRGTYEDAAARGIPWEESKVQQAWDLWGGTPMWEAAVKALEKAGKKTGAKVPNPYLDQPPTASVSLGVWGDEVAEDIEVVLADPQLRLIVHPRIPQLAERLRRAPRRDKIFERVSWSEIRPVEVPGLDEGWYLDELSGQYVVYEDLAEPPYWSREIPHPEGAFTLGEMVELEARLWDAGEAFAQAAEAGLFNEDQKRRALRILEAAEDLSMRLALDKHFAQMSPQERDQAKRQLLEVIADSDEPDEPGPSLRLVNTKLKNKLLR